MPRIEQLKSNVAGKYPKKLRCSIAGFRKGARKYGKMRGGRQACLDYVFIWLANKICGKGSVS